MVELAIVSVLLSPGGAQWWAEAKEDSLAVADDCGEDTNLCAGGGH